jgi:hypothetical protein
LISAWLWQEGLNFNQMGRIDGIVLLFISYGGLYFSHLAAKERWRLYCSHASNLLDRVFRLMDPTREMTGNSSTTSGEQGNWRQRGSTAPYFASEFLLNSAVLLFPAGRDT